MKFSEKFTGLILLLLLITAAQGQKLVPFRMQDTGQHGGFTTTPGEDADYIIFPQSFTGNSDGTITDNNTLLMWQKTDGGEMTWENAASYCDNLVLGAHSDWRLPTAVELFSINNYNNINPALDTGIFTKTQAQYWWSSELQANDPAKVWVVNAGGGVGAHPKNETVSAGGVKMIHVRAVRSVVSTTFQVPHFSDNSDGTIKDNFTGLTWQKVQSPNLMTWEEALTYSKTVTLAGKPDWRLPNVKELQSLNDVGLFLPSFDKNFFPDITGGDFWSSTTLVNNPAQAWQINVDYGIVSHFDKTTPMNVLLVRGGMDNSDLNIDEVPVPGGEYEMGDHNGHYDPSHPNDEIPVHLVKVDSMFMTRTETTNQQFLAFLNASLLSGSVQVSGNRVHLTGDTSTIYYTHQYAPYYSISYDGNSFSIADFRANHPVNGVMWYGAAAFCNWMSIQNGLTPCYDQSTWACDFDANGYRLPTEAEWEYAGRGGHTNPYLKFENGNLIDITQANLPISGDPYEVGDYPHSTPAGFYDGSLKQKSGYNWPGAAGSYQTTDGANGFGLYDMQGNVWEFINDWYAANYYQNSPYDNPKGPDAGGIMPDGKPYRGMRGGNWYNGIDSAGGNDGHSRVSNRDPSYFRGPQDPNHPWYHVGFRFMRHYALPTGTGNLNEIQYDKVLKIYPNPFSGSATIRYFVPQPSCVILIITSIDGRTSSTLADKFETAGWHELIMDGKELPAGIYACSFSCGEDHSFIKMIIMK